MSDEQKLIIELTRKEAYLLKVALDIPEVSTILSLSPEGTQMLDGVKNKIKDTLYPSRPVGRRSANAHVMHKDR